MICSLFLALCLLIVSLSARAAENVLDFLRPIQNANIYKGKVAKYHLNGLMIHTYESAEAYGDWSIVFENEENLVLLEPQTMPESAKELRRYLGGLGKPLAGVLVSYHGVGPDSFPGTPVYASPAAVSFIREGKAEEALKTYAGMFTGVDPKVIFPTHTLDGGRVTIGGIEFGIRYDDGAYPMPGIDVTLPAHRMYYMHMLGGDSHAIIGSVAEVDDTVTFLRKVKEEGYEIFLCSHHMPETVADLDAKIAYLLMVKEVALLSKTADEFISEVKRLAPNQRGEHYLEMTAANLYK